MKIPSIYSEKEIELFKALGCDSYNSYHVPYDLFRVLAAQCFLDNRNDNASDSLRRCIQWINCGNYRKTPEFDNLIQL
jgi:hypothetical protein